MFDKILKVRSYVLHTKAVPKSKLISYNKNQKSYQTRVFIKKCFFLLKSFSYKKLALLRLLQVISKDFKEFS